LRLARSDCGWRDWIAAACSVATDRLILQIIGAVRGRTEYGPRALGHRSLLCYPDTIVRHSLRPPAAVHGSAVASWRHWAGTGPALGWHWAGMGGTGPAAGQTRPLKPSQVPSMVRPVSPAPPLSIDDCQQNAPAACSRGMHAGLQYARGALYQCDYTNARVHEYERLLRCSSPTGSTRV
jgi:hypothetical protein